MPGIISIVQGHYHNLRKAFWGPGVEIARIGDLRYPCSLEVRRAEVARPSGGRDRTRTYEPHGCELSNLSTYLEIAWLFIFD